MNEVLNREKYRELDRLLADEYVMVHINPVFDGVSIPDYLRKDPTVTLQISRFFRGAMLLGTDHIQADLLFDDDYFSCDIPFGAIWGATSAGGEEKIWPASLPEALVKQLSNPGSGKKNNSAKGNTPQSGNDADSQQTNPEPPPAKPSSGKAEAAKKGRSHLKLVK